MLKKLVLIIFIFILLVGCTDGSNRSQQTNSPSFVNVDAQETMSILKMGGGFRLGLTNKATDVDGESITFKLKDTEFSPSISVENSFSIRMKYRIYFLENYKQKQVYIKGKSHDYYDVTLDSNEIYKFSAIIKNIPKGVNDLVVIVIRSPDTYLDNDEFAYGGGRVLKRRVTLISDSGKEFPRKTFNKGFGLDESEEDKDYYPFPIISEKPTSDIDDALTLIKLNKEISSKEIWINFPTNDKEASKFAIIVVLDKKLLEIENKYVMETSNNFISVPIDVSFGNLEDNSANLNVIIIENPYTFKTDMKQGMTDTSWDSYPSNLITFSFE